MAALSIGVALMLPRAFMQVVMVYFPLTYNKRSGERPKYRPNFDTALRYECCVAGDRSRTVMSSIMRRRRGLISAIGKPPV